MKNIPTLPLKVKKTGDAQTERVASQRKFCYSVCVKRFLKQTAVVLLAALVTGCSRGSEQRAVLDDERFEKIYIELLDSTQQIRAAAVDSAAHPIALRVLSRHGATVEQFRATIAYYNNDTQRWKDFFLRVIQRLEKRRSNTASQ